MPSLRTHNHRHKRHLRPAPRNAYVDMMLDRIGAIRRAVLNDEPLGMETTFGRISSDMLVDRVMKLAAGWGTFP